MNWFFIYVVFLFILNLILSGWYLLKKQYDRATYHLVWVIFIYLVASKL